MIPYWSLWTFFFLGLLLSRGSQVGGETTQIKRGLSPAAVLGLAVMTVMIGLRYDVGADWETYNLLFRRTAYLSIGQILTDGDPAYYVMNWLTHRLGAGIWLVNLACASVTVAGIAALARREPQPWLAVLLAIPYLVVVVAMGYTRQAAALGCVMIGLASLLEKNSVGRFIIWLTIAALFHKTAIVCLPLIAFVTEQRKIVNVALVASALIGLYTLLLRDSVDQLVSAYIETRYSSAGAAIRISMSALPAILLLIFRRRLGFTGAEYALWRNYSLVSLSAVLALFLSPSSTAVDRIALYLLPLQFVVISRIPGTLVTRGFGNILVAAYSFAVLFIWLNFAVHAQYWLPYRSWLGD